MADFTLLESHRKNCKEYYQLAKKAVENGHLEKAKRYSALARESCDFIIANSPDKEERIRYRKLRSKVEEVTNAEKQKLVLQGSSITKEEKKSEPIVKKLTVEEALNKLDELEGLQEVKKQVHDFVDQIKVFKMRKARNMAVPEMSYHMVFTGNPGTGKTTVARLIAQIYLSLGILPKGQLIEVKRNDLVAGYVGQTAIKTQEAIDRALGGVLFIDEAYMLDKGGNDFGQEATDTILKAMEDNRSNLAVIVAGYDELMEKFINSNPGLRSRFKNVIKFTDYTGPEMFNIFKGLCKKNQYIMSEEAKGILLKYFNDIYDKRGVNFGNARDVRNLFEKVVTRQSKRVIAIGTHLSNEDMAMILHEDLPIDFTKF